MDLSSITLLVQDQLGGLEVWRDDEQQWIAAHPLDQHQNPNTSELPPLDSVGIRRPNSDYAILVNIGDFMQDWSGHYYRSTRHRVISTRAQPSRVSMAFFAMPDWHAPVSSLISAPKPTNNWLPQASSYLAGDRMPCRA